MFRRTKTIGIVLFTAVLLAACGATPVETDRTPGAQRTKPEPTATQGSSGQQTATEAPATAPTCTETDPHPMGESIAAKYEVRYAEVMTWFCGGASFDDILLALETRNLTDAPVETLLERAEEVGWDQVWVEYEVLEEMEAGEGDGP